MSDDLTTLRRMAEENARIAQETGVGSGSIAFKPQFVIALLDRLERAEAAVARAHEAVITGHDGGRCGVSEHSKSAAASAGYKRCAGFVLAALDTGKETGDAESD